MWIRSQTKSALVNINFMRVINDGNFCLICGATTDGCDYELGVYSTEEKALRVLDEIQAIVESKQFCVVDNVGIGNYVLHNGVQVYQMPADDEVITVKKRVDYAEFRMLEEKEK